MKRFKVEFDLSLAQFMGLMNEGKPPLERIKIDVYEGIDVYEDAAEPMRAKPSDLVRREPKIARVVEERSEPRQRKLRGSKVNNTILDKLKEGSVHFNELKSALTNAGLAPTSLSTGLSLLQKSGQIKRLGEGMYGLAEAA